MSPTGISLEPKRKWDAAVERKRRAFQESGALGRRAHAGCHHGGDTKALGTFGSERAPCRSKESMSAGAATSLSSLLSPRARRQGRSSRLGWPAAIHGAGHSRNMVWLPGANRTSVRVGGGWGEMVLCLLGTMTCQAEFKSNQTVKQARSAKHSWVMFLSPTFQRGQEAVIRP